MIKAVIFDFDGVLCHDRFYEEMLLPQYQELYNWIQDNIFGNNNLFYQWMRNEVNTNDINKIIAKGTGHKEEFLKDVLLKSLEAIRLDEKMFNLAKELKKLHGKKIAIITDNMDVFNSITIEKHNLNKTFPVIINSCDYGILKCEENGRLFDIAMDKLRHDDYKNALLIDDSEKTREIFKKKGGNTFAYTTYEEFKPWAKENLIG